MDRQMNKRAEVVIVREKWKVWGKASKLWTRSSVPIGRVRSDNLIGVRVQVIENPSQVFLKLITFDVLYLNFSNDQ